MNHKTVKMASPVVAHEFNEMVDPIVNLNITLPSDADVRWDADKQCHVFTIKRPMRVLTGRLADAIERLGDATDEEGVPRELVDEFVETLRHHLIMKQLVKEMRIL